MTSAHLYRENLYAVLSTISTQDIYTITELSLPENEILYTSLWVCLLRLHQFLRAGLQKSV